MKNELINNLKNEIMFLKGNYNLMLKGSHNNLKKEIMFLKSKINKLKGNNDIIDEDFD
jgi:hypothetical protein